MFYNTEIVQLHSIFLCVTQEMGAFEYIHVGASRCKGS